MSRRVDARVAAREEAEGAGMIKVNGVPMSDDEAAEKVRAALEGLTPEERDAVGADVRRQFDSHRLVRQEDRSITLNVDSILGRPRQDSVVKQILSKLDPLSLEDKREVLEDVAKDFGITEADIQQRKRQLDLQKRKAALENSLGTANEKLAAARELFRDEMADVHAPFLAFCKAIRGYEQTIEPGAHLMALGRIFVGEEDGSAAELADLVQSIEEVATIHSSSRAVYSVYSELIPNWEGGLAYLRSVLDDENSAFPIYFSRRWARVGYPVIELGHKVAASLMFTHGSGAIEAPWPAFSLKVPDGLVTLSHDGVDANATRLLCMRPTDAWNKWLLRADFRKINGPDAGSEKPFYLSPTALDDTLDIRSEEGATWPELNRALEMMCRLAAGACMLATAKQDIVEREWRPKVKAERRRTPGVEPPVGTRFIVAKNVDLDLREQVHEYISGQSRKGGKLTVQFVVRGHRRWQACGPKHSERKLIWINPFWKGPEEGRALLRGYELRAGETEPTTSKEGASQ